GTVAAGCPVKFKGDVKAIRSKGLISVLFSIFLGKSEPNSNATQGVVGVNIRSYLSIKILILLYKYWRSILALVISSADQFISKISSKESLRAPEFFLRIVLNPLRSVLLATIVQNVFPMLSRLKLTSSTLHPSSSLKTLTARFELLSPHDLTRRIPNPVSKQSLILLCLL